MEPPSSCGASRTFSHAKKGYQNPEMTGLPTHCTSKNPSYLQEQRRTEDLPLSRMPAPICEEVGVRQTLSQQETPRCSRCSIRKKGCTEGLLLLRMPMGCQEAVGVRQTLSHQATPRSRRCRRCPYCPDQRPYRALRKCTSARRREIPTDHIVCLGTRSSDNQHTCTTECTTTE